MRNLTNQHLNGNEEDFASKVSNKKANFKTWRKKGSEISYQVII